jgi:hypothetical protein
VYLSANKEFIQTVESDHESLHGALCYHIALLKSEDTKLIEGHIKSYTTAKERSGLPHIMHSRHILNLLNRLFQFGTHFHLSTAMSKAWVKQNLMATAGGVSPSSRFHCIVISLNISTVYHGLCKLLSQLLGHAPFPLHPLRARKK